jgi:hypothetical protein
MGRRQKVIRRKETIAQTVIAMNEVEIQDCIDRVTRAMLPENAN